MDDFEKKLFVQLDDDFPGVRVQALDSLRDHLKKTGQSFRDILHEFENSIPQQKYADLEAQHNTALQHNAEFAQRDQQQEQKIAELSRKVALYKAVASVRLNWRWAAGLAVLPVIGWFGYQFLVAPAWPENADSGLRHMASSEVVWGQWFDKPFVKTIAGKPLWVLVQGQVDSTNFSDKDGRAIVMHCLHVFAAPAEPDSGAYVKPQPYGLFGWLKWPERVVHCTPAPNQNEASR
jgi:hypothetical protein